MHELGVVFTVIKSVEELAVKNNIDNVDQVTLQIGEVSGIVNKYLTDVWQWACAKRSTYMTKCQLEIETIKAITYCEDCKCNYETVEYGKICPHCGSEHTYLIQGNEFIIKDIRVKNNSD